VIHAPIALPLLLLFLLVVGVFILIVEIRAIAYAYRVIGISPRYVSLVLVLTLLGSYINLPLYRVAVARVLSPQIIERFGRSYVVPPVIEPGVTIVAINVGGALIPILVSIYLFLRTRERWRMLLAIAVVAIVVHSLAQVVPGAGIAVPMLIPPLTAAGVALVLAFREAPAVAYVAGSLGALIGADVLNLPRVAELGAPVVAIGGAGTFDGVFLTGILAGLLAAWIAPAPHHRARVESESGYGGRDDRVA
jgi:uncharacterized membrane protein